MIVSKHLPLGKRGCFAEAEPIRFSPAKTINSLENYEISTNACHPDTIKGSHKDMYHLGTLFLPYSIWILLYARISVPKS